MYWWMRQIKNESQCGERDQAMDRKRIKDKRQE